jgi:hypothetical protein
MIAPSMVLDGAAPRGKTLSSATHKDLKARLGSGKGAKMSLTALDLFGKKVVHVLNTREVPLGSVDKDLQGVVGVVYEPVNVGASGGRAAVLGAMPQPDDTDKEVIEFVKSLLEHDRIDLDKKKKSAVASAAGTTDGKRSATTHAIKTVGGKKVLRRVRFLCGHH